MKPLANHKIKFLFCRIGLCILVFTIFSAVLLFVESKSASWCIFLCSLCMSLFIMAVCFQYFREQNAVLESAAAQVMKYIAGNSNARIACDEEGELYHLFHEVNSLVAILNAHAENEGKTKEFLKDTISDVSHQLKTPLSALNIYNGILQEETRDLPDIQEFVILSEQELDRMESLVQNLLKITKLDANIICIDKASEKVSKMMEEVKKHFGFRARQEGKEIHLAGDPSVMLLCDRVWLMEAVDNIVKNALDHTEKGDSVWIEWKQFISVVQLVIRDNGSGIHPEDLYHIFKRFYRSRFSKDTQGIGLGLPLAKAIIEAHSGTVEVDSEWGQGTAFTINFLIPTRL